MLPTVNALEAAFGIDTYIENHHPAIQRYSLQPGKSTTTPQAWTLASNPAQAEPAPGGKLNENFFRLFRLRG
jgi:hypothetical protein